MYADRVEAEAQANRSIRDRLNGNSAADSGRRRPIAGKRSTSFPHICVFHMCEGNVNYLA